MTEALAAGSNDVPATVGDAMLARYRQLSVETQAAVEQLSVVPGQIDLGLAEAVLGGQLDFLAEAEQHGILEVRGGALAFRHELARRAVQRSLSAIRRRAVNRAVVEALRAAQVPDLDRLVHHAVEGGAVDALLTYAPQAGREAARAGSHRQALAHFEAVLCHADRLDTAEHARVVLDYGWELHHALRFDEAVRAGRRRLKDLGVRRVPRGPSSSTRANPAGLTDRQAQVLALLAERLTNAEIAQRLVLSVRTVDHHVAAILTNSAWPLAARPCWPRSHPGDDGAP